MSHAASSWDKYIVPVITTVVGGVVLVFVLKYVDGGNAPAPTPREPDRKVKPENKDDPPVRATGKVAPPIKEADLVGEWEKVSTGPNLGKQRLIFAKAGKVFWKRGDRTDRVEYAVKAGKVELAGATSSDKPLVYEAERNGKVLTFDRQGVSIGASGLAKLEGDWKHVGDPDAEFERKPVPMDAKLLGRWRSAAPGGAEFLEVVAPSTFHLRKGNNQTPVVSGSFEFTGKTTLDVIVNGREVFPMKIAFLPSNQIELTTPGKPIGEEERLVGKWVKIQ